MKFFSGIWVGYEINLSLFSVLSPFQRLTPFQFPLSVSAIQFQRFIPTREKLQVSI
jgi:hypothetical protein